MVTDGAPNTYGNNVSAGGVQFRAMEEAVLSANALKHAGKQILAVGVGGINNKPAEGKLNLAAISDESHDFIGDWDDLGTQLANIAKNLTCQGTVTVTKTTVNGQTTTPNATGWAFTAANTGGKGSTSDAGTQTTTRPEAVGFVDLPVRRQGRHAPRSTSRRPTRPGGSRPASSATARPSPRRATAASTSR